MAEPVATPAKFAISRALRQLPVTVGQDGAPELSGLVLQMCVRHGVVPACELIDRFPVDERIAEVCERFAEVCERFAKLQAARFSTLGAA